MKEQPDTTLTAKEALLKTIENAITMEKILRAIDSAAENGMNCIRLFDVFIPFDIMKQLLDFGYLISQQTGQFGENIIKINW